jgi:hypothetical protein
MQKGFRTTPIQHIVAFSDGARVERERGWAPPQAPFVDYVCKADQVVEKIRTQLERHRKGSGLLSRQDGEYGLWSQTTDEMKKVVDLLLQRHQRRSVQVPVRPTAKTPPPRETVSATPDAGAPAPSNKIVHASVPAAPPEAKCRHCGGTDLDGRWGKFGYHWHCAGCGKNTPMPTTCTGCGAVGKHGRGVKIQKRGPEFIRICEACCRQEAIWRQLQTP